MNSQQYRVESDDSGLDLPWVWSILRRRAWIIGLCVLGGIFLAFLVTSSLPEKYEATMTLMVQPAWDARTSTYDDLLIGARLAIAYTDMVKSQLILDEIISRLNLTETPEKLADKITAAAVKDTQLIRLTVTDSSPDRAALITNTLGETLSENVQKIQTQRYSSSLKSLEGKIQDYSATIADTQDQINLLNAKRSEAEAEISRLETQNNHDQNEYQSLQQSRNALQLTISQQTDQVKMIEPAHTVTGVNYPQPTATFLLMFDQSMLGGNSSVIDALFAERLKATYGPMIKGQSLLSEVINQLKLADTPETMVERISIVAISGAPMLRIYVMYPDSNQALSIADAVANGFLTQVQAQLASPYNSRLTEIQQQLDKLTAGMNQNQAEIKRLSVEKVNGETELAQRNILLTITTNDLHTAQQNYDQMNQTALETADQVVTVIPAQAPDQPVDRRLINMAMAALVGLMLGIGLVFVVEKLDDRIRTNRDVANTLGLKILSNISPLPQSERETYVDAMPFSGIAEDFRLLGTKILLARENDALKILMVTSPSSSEGKSVTVANLAIALARSGLNVVLVDADLRRPRLHEIFDLPQENGLTECIQSGYMNGCLHHSKTKGLSVLTSGNIPDEPIELLTSPALAKVFDELSNQADLVLIDCPPILPVADTSVLAALADSTLLVLRSGISESRDAREAYATLYGNHAQFMGVVLVGVSSHGDKYHKYYRADGEKPGNE
jgi:polysaccharide biosynthesis transport protein